MEGLRLSHLGDREAEEVQRREARDLWFLLVCGKYECRQALESRTRGRKGRDRQGCCGESQAKGCFYQELLALFSRKFGFLEPLFPGPA